MLCDYIRNSRDPFIAPRPKYKIKSGSSLLNERVRTLSVALKKSFI